MFAAVGAAAVMSRMVAAANLVDKCALYQEDGEREHDADPEGDHRCLRLIPRAVQVGHAVAHHAG